MKSSKVLANVDAVKAVDPKLLAILSKLNPGGVNQQPHFNKRGERDIAAPNVSSFYSLLTERARRNRDSKNILKMLPDQELSVQILTSSIMSPADMLTVELHYEPDSEIFTSDLTATLVELIRKYLEQDCEIKKQIPIILRDIVAEKGSHPVAVIPENAIDALINADRYRISAESLKTLVMDDGVTPRPVGLLGPGIDAPTPSTRARLTLEAFNTTHANINRQVVLDNKNGIIFKDDFVSVTDNVMVLKFPKLYDKLRRTKVHEAISQATGGFSLESVNTVKSIRQISDRSISNQLFTPRHNNSEPMVALKRPHELTRKSVGRPLIMKLPSESVLPVYVPGDVHKHIAYFVLLDEEGNPISAENNDDFYRTAAASFNANNRNSMATNLLQRAGTNFGFDTNAFDPGKRMHLEFMAKAYSDMLERDLIARIKNGVHSSTVQISQSEEAYRLMLSRSLKGKYTQLLYIPADYLTYITLAYNSDGIGESLIDSNSVINTLRVMLMFSDVLGAVKNSIGRTRVNVTLPEEDPDPVATMEEAKDVIIRSRSLDLPFAGGWSASDIMDFLQSASFEWGIEGGDLPDLKFNFESANTNYPKSDSDLTEGLRKLSIMGLGLSPETVDNSQGSEFATVAQQNNLLTTKRIVQYQETLNPLLTSHYRKILTFSQDIVERMYDKVNESKDSIKYTVGDDEQELIAQYGEEEFKKYKVTRALSEFIQRLNICLPKPPKTSLGSQAELVKDYSDFLDSVLEGAYISQYIVTDALSANADAIRAQIKAYFMRKFMAEKGIGTELSALVASTEDGEPQVSLFMETAKFSELMTRSCVKGVAKLTPVNNAAQADLDKLGAPTPPEDNSGGDDNGSSGDDFGTGDDNFDDMGGGEDATSTDESGTADTGDQTQEGEEPPTTPNL